MFDIKFSFFKKPISNVYPYRTINILQVVHLIQSEIYKDITKIINAEPDKDKRKKLKDPNLDYVTFAGVFKRRANNQILKQSGLCAIDVDDFKTDISTLKSRLSKDPYIFVLSNSPSGQGLKPIIKVPLGIEEYPQYAMGFYKYLNEKYGIGIEHLDTGTREISRATYLCHDPECVFNPNSKVWDKTDNMQSSVHFRLDNSNKNHKKERDLTPSGFEFRRVMYLLDQGYSESKIHQMMASYPKWSSRRQSYYDWTFKKARRFLREAKNGEN